MMTLLWQDALDDLSAAKLHFREAVAIFENAGFMPGVAPDYVNSMAFQHAMQSGYTSFEGALKRIFAMLDEPLPVGGDWHRDLVMCAIKPIPDERPAIIGEALASPVLDLMRFRHVAMHSYDRFDVEKAAVAVGHARSFLGSIDADIARFRAVIDPPT